MIGGFQFEVDRIGLAAPEGGGNANCAFAVVEAIRSICGTPEVRLQAVVGIGAAAGDGDQGANMAENAADKVPTGIAQTTALAGIKEEILSSFLAALGAPQAHMDVRTAASLIEERLGGKAGHEIEAACHTSNGFANKADVIGSAQYVGVMNREFLLGRAEFCVEEFDGDAFGLKRFKYGVDHFRLVIQAYAAVAEAGIGGHIISVLLASQVKFMLDGSFSAHAMFREARNHTFKESARARFPGLPIEENHIAHHTTCIGNIGQNNEGVGIRN